VFIKIAGVQSASGRLLEARADDARVRAHLLGAGEQFRGILHNILYKSQYIFSGILVNDLIAHFTNFFPGIGLTDVPSFFSVVKPVNESGLRGQELGAVYGSENSLGQEIG